MEYLQVQPLKTPISVKLCHNINAFAYEKDSFKFLIDNIINYNILCSWAYVLLEVALT